MNAWIFHDGVGYGVGSFFPKGDELWVQDNTPEGGWGVAASVQRYIKDKDEWAAITSCKANDQLSGATKCKPVNIAEGALVRVHAWMVKGSETKWHSYSTTTHA
ncbi:hypothetical protein J4573_15790 [Actinomadura barringtoniae]|uniref:Uncharacterized protein n=1 Tax=Actinomadura barringtoniae TaxID=1427535 RepID=A0A939P9S6_9ACTN|nr:hypothetical protein [Actinomadura barringtoniae]MBO2448565.1 hypothetical protein [Actinomadura barringtoniae]